MKTFILLVLAPVFTECTHSPVRDKTEAGIKTHCEDVNGSVKWSFCITEMANSSDDLLYYFHGGGGSETSWSDPDNYSKILKESWKARQMRSPRVVTVSFGPMWILTKKNKKAMSGLYEVFLNEVIPYVESKTPRVKERWLLGESMGGFSAAQLALQGQVPFTRVALVCPGVDSHGADKKHEDMMRTLLNNHFENEEQIQAALPVNLVAAHPQYRQKFYISCGTKDQFGFFPGSYILAQTLQKKGIQTQWKPLTGKHCVVDTDSLSAFLAL